jgi:arsenite methyltransferase
MDNREIHKVVREGYAKIAKQNTSCCGNSKPATQQSGCGCGCNTTNETAESLSKAVGYSSKEMAEVPEGANLGLGCGNPVALASLKPGEVVLDLGSGAGFDCFLAASRVGPTGKVIGVDMTPEMLDKARENAVKGKYTNVEFRLGEIENLPVANDTIDIIISNCVINLSADKNKVFQEAYRVLKPEGRLMVSDIVILKELPANIKQAVAAYVGCISGAIGKEEYLSAIKESGLNNVRIIEESVFPLECMANDPTAQAIIDDLNVTPKQIKELTNSIASIKVSAVK